VEETNLDDLAVSEGTDKSSVEHDYARQYERAFDQFRDANIDVLEIGIASGSSLRMWEKYFTRARLVGVDIIDECVRHQGGRKVVEIGSQADPVFLEKLATKYAPTIIIDDGSHQADHIELTLRHLFPSLQPGGCYVIEDLHFHDGAENSTRPVGALKLTLDIAFATALSHPDATVPLGLDRAFIQTVDRVEFVRHAALLWKKVPDLNPFQTVARMRQLIERSGSAQNWFNFIYYSLERGGSLEDSEIAARKSIALGNRSGLAHWRLSEVLERRGDISAAITAAQQAHDLAPEIAAISERLERLRARTGP
jgi:hypothetical protein